jgi:hypothetical protein
MGNTVALKPDRIIPKQRWGNQRLMTGIRMPIELRDVIDDFAGRNRITRTDAIIYLVTYAIDANTSK